MDLIEAGRLPRRPDQRRPRPRPPSQQFLAGTGSMLMWWGDVGSSAHAPRTPPSWAMSSASASTRRPSASTTLSQAGAWEETRNEAPTDGLHRLGRLRHRHASRRRRAEAARQPGPPRPTWAARTCRFGRRPIRRASSPTATRTSTTTSGKRPATTGRMSRTILGSNADSYNHPNAAIEPRIPGIFQYYSVAEDELAKGYAGQYASAQETADAIAAAWEKPSPTRSGATARLRCIKPRLAYDRC